MKKRKKGRKGSDYEALRTATKAAPPKTEIKVPVGPPVMLAMNCGGKTKMAHRKSGGMTCRGGGAASRGTKFSRNG